MMSTTTKMITSSSSSIQKVAPFSCPTVERTPVPQPMIERSVHPSRSYIYINFLEIIFIEWGNILTPSLPIQVLHIYNFFLSAFSPYVINLHFPFSIALVASGPAFPLPRNHLPIFFREFSLLQYPLFQYTSSPFSIYCFSIPVPIIW